MNKYCRLFISLIFIFLSKSTVSHELSKLHDICMNSSDYQGCIDSNKYIRLFPSNQIHEWRSYGPLNVNWSEWRYDSTNHITIAYNKQKKLIYLAINCKAYKINTAVSSNKWRGWFSPVKRFESKLVSDLCRASKKLNNI